MSVRSSSSTFAIWLSALCFVACEGPRADFQPTKDSAKGDKNEEDASTSKSDDDSEDTDDGATDEPDDESNGDDGPASSSASTEPGVTSPGMTSSSGGEPAATTTSTATTPSGTTTDAPAASTTTPNPNTTGTAPGCATQCCGNEDCGTGSSCVDGSCACNSGTKPCDGACIPEADCCTDDECPTDATCSSGDCACADDAHLCDDACVSNASPETCGQGCEPCMAPTGGESGCDGTACTATCPANQKLCAGGCIPEADPCDASCPGGTHDCNGVCSLTTSTLACGDSCEPCPVPAHSMATCDGMSCDFACNNGYTRCGDTCIADDACCEDGDCEGAMLCMDNACQCAAGQKECDSACIDEDACCRDNECGFGNACEDNECVDVQAPKVSQITPSDGANGIAANATIQVTFNEAMNQDSVKNALTISSLPSSSYTLAWSGGGTVLTITPTSPLLYSNGTSPDAGAREYTVTIAATATDVTGNTLTTKFESSFMTLRHITQTLTASGVAYWSSYGKAVGDGPSVCPTASGNVLTGHHSSQAASGDYRIFVRFDTSSAGEGDDVVSFESATFSASQGAAQGAFYPSGSVTLEKVEDGPIGRGLYDLETTDDLGTFATSAASSPSKDVTDAVWAAWSDGDAGHVFKLDSANAASSTYAVFSCTGFSLVIDYIKP